MNRKYLVDTTTREYLCVALKKGQDWVPNNQDVLQRFMSSRSNSILPETELLSGEFNDNSFFEKWIRNGTNFLFQY
ncbi:hypothetical protein [Pontibacter actiniarum]|uniref:Uncharacterized protein n=1 Tax=Pontibacter actiniarum TaxID=323450 RepID=A0A1X9YP31_9BACT|nr:hypothetical protein [Pontibacter actiniarum]ARS34604.1 hypothetical protein CA264_03610 [Pontibacter actiniarum]